MLAASSICSNWEMYHHMLMCDADVRDLWAIWSSKADTTVSMLTVADCNGSMTLTCRQQHVKYTCTSFCRGSNKETRGTAYVVYEDIYDAKTAVEHLSGFNVANRYLIVLYYNHNKHSKKVCPACSNLCLKFFGMSTAFFSSQDYHLCPC